MSTKVQSKGQNRSPPSEIKDKFSLIFEMLWLHILIIPSILAAFYRRIIPPREKSLKGQVALVTGAGRGIGRGIAVALAKEGCKVAVVDVNMTNAEETAKEICSVGGQAKAYCTNVAKIEEIRALREAVTKDLGSVELLVNNAGIGFAEPVEESSEEIVLGIMNVNLFSHFWMAREFLPEMRKRNTGHIVAMASAVSFSPQPNSAAYAASKFGLRAFMDVLRIELQARTGNNIKTTTIYPYFVDTGVAYSAIWELRLPPITIESVVSATITGIKRNSITVAVPEMSYYMCHLLWLLPQSIIDKSSEIFYTRVQMSKEDREKHPYKSIVRELAK